MMLGLTSEEDGGYFVLDLAIRACGDLETIAIFPQAFGCPLFRGRVRWVHRQLEGAVC